MRKNCLVCHSKLNELHANNSYRKCPSCGSFCVDQMPNRQKIIKGLNNWAKEIIRDDDKLPPTKITYERVNTLIRLNRKGNNLLDVGCGKVDFLVAAKKAKFRVSGMDVAEPIIKQLVRHNIPSYRSLSEIRDTTFDVVTCFDVVEHTTNPMKLLQEVCRITKNGGILFLSTPNAASISARLLRESWWVFGPKGHYVLFTPTGIRTILKRNGYSVINIKTNLITQWIHTRSQLVNKIGNKIIYCVTFPFLSLLFRSGLGDNIDIYAKKTIVR